MKNSKYLIIILLSVMFSCEKNENILPEIDMMVHSIAVDKYNVKWIGTDEGLYKSVKEGYELQELSVSGEIYSLFYDESHDNLWIGTESGLLKAAITAHDISDHAIDIENLSHPKVLSFHIDNNFNYWFGTLKGISLNYGEAWKKENFRVNAQDILFAMDIEDFTVNSIAGWYDDYFFATSGAKLYRAFDYNTGVNAFSGATQWSSPYNGQSITDTMFVVFIDSEGKQWMGGKQGIQVHSGHDPKDQSSFTYYNMELPDPYILAINQDPEGNIWVGTRKGLGVFDGSAWEILTEGLPDLYVSSIEFDADGSAWIGTKQGLVNIR